LAAHPTLRTHKMKVGLFTESGDAFALDFLLQNKEITEV